MPVQWTKKELLKIQDRQLLEEIRIDWAQTMQPSNAYDDMCRNPDCPYIHFFPSHVVCENRTHKHAHTR